MSYRTDEHLAQGRFSLSVQIDQIDSLAGKYEFAAKVTEVWDDAAAQDVTHLVACSLHEHWGTNPGEAQEKAMAEAQQVLGIDTGEIQGL